MKVEEQLIEIKKKEHKVINECFNEWEDELRKNFPRYEIIRQGDGFNNSTTCNHDIVLYLYFRDIKLNLEIEFIQCMYSSDYPPICINIKIESFNKRQKKEIRELLCSIIPSSFELKQNSCSAKCYTTFEKGYTDFKNLIEHIKKKIKNDETQF